ncbi:9151_t:CDS:1, partial [Cetraspora pellucida]
MTEIQDESFYSCSFNRNQNLIDNILGDSLEESNNKDDKEVIKEKKDLFYTPLL